MEREDSSRGSDDAWEVRTPLQARLLSDARSRGYFLPFLGRTRSVSEAADEVGCALDAMHYRVRRFLAAGLLEVRGERRRAGRPIKLYRSVRDAFYIPFTLTPYAELEERVLADMIREDERVVRALARALRAGGVEGRRLYRDARGQDMYESASEAGAARDWQAVMAAWPADRPVTERASMELQLTDEEARRMLVDLYTILERHLTVPADGRSRRTYHAQVGVVPWED
jgi:hypothetical protein